MLSPPLGMKTLDESDAAKLTSFVDRVVSDGLQELSCTFDDDGDNFKARVLRFICTLTIEANIAHPVSLSDIRLSQD